jgi:diguanylate cyclase (GGDEF)-like protein/PAS domain S-box-containing protein
MIFAIAYLGTALISRAVSFQDASSPTVWLPGGLFVAVLLTSPVIDWPVYLLAVIPALLADAIIAHEPLLLSAIFYITTVLEVTTGAWLIRRFRNSPSYFETPGDVFYLMIFSAGIGSLLSATLNTMALITMQQVYSFWGPWQIAWISHALGVLVFAPAVLAWSGQPIRFPTRVSPERLIELAVLSTSLIICGMYIFVGRYGVNRLSYMVIPFLVWSALRFGSRGITTHGLVLTLIAGWGTAYQLPGFAINDMTILPVMEAVGSFLAFVLLSCDILATVLEQNQRTEQALRRSEERYRLLIENQGEGIGVVSPDETFTLANPAAAQIFGVFPESLVGRNLKEFTNPQQFDIIRGQTSLRQQGKKTSYELEITQPASRRCSLIITATPQYDPEGSFIGTFAIIHDQTERKQSESALRDSRARFQTLFDHSPIPTWEEDFSRVKRLIDGLRRDGVEDFREYFNQHPDQRHACEHLIHVLDANRAALQLFNIDNKAEFMAQVSSLIERGPNDIVVEELVAIADGRTEFEMEGPNDLVDGVIRYHQVRWSVAPGYEDDFRRVIVSTLDITERKQAEEQMRYLSTHDVLTGLYNRNFFEAELERMQHSRLEPINVMVIDINGMKATNDAYGHSAGDDLLRRTAQVLRTSFRKEDVIARVGGDEFVVLFSGAIALADSVQRVKDCLVDHNSWHESPALSLAIGAASGGKVTALLDLYKKADQQMYKEKQRAKKPRPDNKPETKPGNSP